MNIITKFISEHGVEILQAIFTFIAGYLGIYLKRIVTEWFNDKTKQKVARVCVKAVEQIYTDLHGEDKLNECIKAVTAMLEEKGITITELEIRMLIESAVGEFNNSFKKNDSESADDETEAGE